jgi:hypothetical protein
MLNSILSDFFRLKITIFRLIIYFKIVMAPLLSIDGKIFFGILSTKTVYSC